MNEARNKENEFAGFDYREVTVKKEMMPVYVDSYGSFGWIPEGSTYPMGKIDSIILKFKRNRKITNKAELTRLQRQFDANAAEIMKLESSKMTKAATVAYITGVIGTAFMAGSVFSVTSGNVGLCILMAIPGFVGWIIPFLLFKNISDKKTEQINPIINQKYEELYSTCEKASALLH